MSGKGGRIVWRLLLPVLLAGATVAWIGGEKALAAISKVTPWRMGVAVIAFLAIHVGCALKWRYTLTGFGSSLSVRHAIRAHGAGLAANLWLPSVVGGDLVRTALAIRHGTRSEALVLSSLVDRVADLLALLLLGLVGVVLRGSPGNEKVALSTLVPLTLGIFLALALGVMAAIRLRWTSLLNGKPRRLGLRIRVALRRVSTARLFVALAASAGLQAALLFTNRWLAADIGTPLDLDAWLIAWPLAKACAMLPLGFGGLGVRELAFAALATPLGFPRDLAVSQSLMWQGVLMTGGLLAGGLCGFVATEPSLQRKPA